MDKAQTEQAVLVISVAADLVAAVADLVDHLVAAVAQVMAEVAVPTVAGVANVMVVVPPMEAI